MEAHPDDTQPEMDPGNAEPLLLTPLQAARVLSIGRTTLYTLLASSALASVQIGTCRRITYAALEDYVAGLRTDPLRPVTKRPGAAGGDRATGVVNRRARTHDTARAHDTTRASLGPSKMRPTRSQGRPTRVEASSLPFTDTQTGSAGPEHCEDP